MKLFYSWIIVGAAMVVTCVGFGAIAIAFTFRPPRQLPAALPSPSVAH